MIMLSTNLLIINVILIKLMFVGLTISTMSCYQCHTNDNRLCLESGSQPCPPNQAYDSCMTTIYRKPIDGLHIKKECALAPCELRDPALNKILSLKEICAKDKSKDCIHCCKTDGCNTDGVSMISVHKLLMTSMIAMITVFTLFSLNF